MTFVQLALKIRVYYSWNSKTVLLKEKANNDVTQQTNYLKLLLIDLYILGCKTLIAIVDSELETSWTWTVRRSCGTHVPPRHEYRHSGKVVTTVET